MSETASGQDEEAAAWRRLDRRMLAVAAGRGLLSVLPLLAALVLFGAELDRGVRTALTVALLLAVSTTIREAVRWYSSRYRVTGQRVELRTGLLTREARWVPRDRVRSVDLTARPLQRLFGLAAITVGTGEKRGASGRSRLRLDAIRAAEATRLRRLLLADQEPVATPAPAGSQPLARFEPGWLRYELLSWWTIAIPVIAFGGAFQLINSLGLVRTDAGLADQAWDTAAGLPPVLLAIGIPLAVLAAGIVAALAFSLEHWWGYVLERRQERGGTLTVRHGLFTRRAKDIEERRMRGVELTETPLLRLAGGATPAVVATGLSGGGNFGESPGALGPSMPRSRAAEISGLALRDQGVLTDARQLLPHPVAAWRRRRTRAVLAAVVATVGVAATLVNVETATVPAVLFGLATGLVALVSGLLAARDSYRALGHRLGRRYLVSRNGLLRRRTVALEREGIIGWNLRRTYFQRRLGLSTLTATTAAGRGSYSVIDVEDRDAVALAREIQPSVVGPVCELPEGS